MSTSFSVGDIKTARTVDHELETPKIPVAEGALVSALLAVFALAVGGYHPFAEDGGLYLTGVQYLLHPALYGHSLPFVTAHLHYSVFAPMLAGLVRWTGVSLEAVVLLVFMLCTWAILFAGWLIAAELFPRREERVGGTFLLAMWLGLPVAGTSLAIADPYLTARSVSTPCVLFAIAFILRWCAMARKGRARASLRPAALSLAALVAGALVHPLMAGYGAVCVGILVLLELRLPVSQAARWLGLTIAAFALCLFVAEVTRTESVASRAAALTRTYWFLGQWQWYELFGLAAPLVLLAFWSLKARLAGARAIARACLAAGSTAALSALLFAHAQSRSLEVSRLQPLRLFQVVYMAMTLLLGAWLGRMLGRSWWRWAVAALVLGSVMNFVARQPFPAGPALELPYGRGAYGLTNPWTNAFVWAREHTPVDALFALDANYISLPKEDAQSFRALAQRSSLPDRSKDGGEAAITPVLAELWQQGVAAQESLSAIGDAERARRLKPLGVTWVVLQSSAITARACPYDNGTVKVCPLA